jgi:Tetratricopeptide repeat
LARLTRRELKVDKLQTAFEDYEAFALEHYKEILAVVGIGLVLVGAVLGLRYYTAKIEADANTKLGAALETYNAYVGEASPGLLGPGALSFPTADEKYKKALAQFQTAAQVSGFEKLLPELKAVRIAKYHAGLCEAQLGDDPAAIKTLQSLSKDRDPDIASLAKFAMAEEYVKTNKLPDAVKIFQDLSDHPSSTVPRATALLALADAYRPTQPAQARQIYDRMEKEYGTDATLADVLKQQISSLPQ